MTKAHFICPKEHFLRNNFFEKNRTYLNFTDFERFPSKFGQNFQQRCQNCTLYARGTFWGKAVALKNFYSRTISDCVWNVFGWTFKKTSDVSRGNFSRKKFPFWKNHAIFGLLQKFFPKLWYKRFCKMVKTAFELSRGACFLKKNALGNSCFFFKLGPWRNFCESFAEHFRQVIENCILRVHRNTLWKFFLFWQTFFFVLGLWLRDFQFFRQKTIVSLFRIAFNVSRGTIWWKLVVSKNLVKLYHFGTLSGNALLSCWIPLARLLDPHSRVPTTFRG